MKFYIVKTNPREAGDYGGTDYKKTLVYSNTIVSKEDLKVLVNKCLKVPFYNLWKPLYIDATEIAHNIVIEEIEEKSIEKTYKELTEKINDKYYFEDFQLLEFALKDDYRRTFPENFKFTKVPKECILDIIESTLGEKVAQQKAKEQEDLKLEFKRLLNKLDKETILQMMIDNTK